MRPLITALRNSPRAPWYAVLASLATVGFILSPSRALRSENFVIYQPNSRAVLPLQVIGQAKYLPLLPMLNAIGKIGAIQEKRELLRVWFGETEIELHLDDQRVRVGQRRLTLPQPARKPGTQWLVPVEFLAAALPLLTQQAVEYRIGASRIFLGDVKPLTFSLRLDPTGNGARLTVQFNDKVTVRTAASNGKWYLYLGDRPVQPLEQSFRFQDPYVSEVLFDDQDGVPKLVITPTAGGLNFYPASAEGGKVLLAEVLRPPMSAPSQPPATGVQQPEATPPTPGTGATVTLQEPEPGAPGPPLPVVVLDPGHGAEDTGARGRDGLLEKDLVANLTARVRQTLLATQKYRVQLTRVGDIRLSFEQRETVANTARPVAFFSFHAGDLGNAPTRVAVFCYRGIPADQAEVPQLLIPWNRVYRTHQDQSRRLARLLQEKFAQIPGLSSDQPAEAPVRCLRSIDAPAVAIEIGSLNADRDSGPLTDPGFQQQLAMAIAAGLEAFRAETP